MDTMLVYGLEIYSHKKCTSRGLCHEEKFEMTGSGESAKG